MTEPGSGVTAACPHCGQNIEAPADAVEWAESEGIDRFGHVDNTPATFACPGCGKQVELTCRTVVQYHFEKPAKARRGRK